ncbi:hypothetical protein PRZ61_12285 [Halomonas pacifica]|uniref:hypothetical protein n=1 Tax=Bisbaumannia pacifica TaxID=77098 RepID=UPI002358218E|nr:hypothetical protein [Halomonas pacifica]MDC8804220.1 hypothetical protein [Halomonas pacifica]
MTTRKRTTTKANQAKAQQPKATQEAEAKAAQGEDAKNTEVATQDPAKEPAAKDGPIQDQQPDTPPAAGKDATGAKDGATRKTQKGEIPALFIRTKRRYKSRRRAGHRFSREGYAIALAALSEGQIEQLKADPALEVEECSFPADPDDDPES